MNLDSQSDCQILTEMLDNNSSDLAMFKQIIKETVGDTSMESCIITNLDSRVKSVSLELGKLIVDFALYYGRKF